MEKLQLIHKYCFALALAIFFSISLAQAPLKAEEYSQASSASVSPAQEETFTSGVKAAKEDFKGLGRNIKGFFGRFKGVFKSSNSSKDGVVEKDLAQSAPHHEEPKGDNPNQNSQSNSDLDAIGNEEDVVL